MPDKSVDTPRPLSEDRIYKKIDSTLQSTHVRRDVIAGVAAATGLVAEIKLGFLRNTLNTLLKREQSADSNWGKPIEGVSPQTLVTTPVEGGINKVPVRSRPSLSDKDIVGYAKFGTRVENATAVLGAVYPSASAIGNIEHEGAKFGTWYKVNVPITDTVGEAKNVEAFISGNFVKKLERTE